VYLSHQRKLNKIKVYENNIKEMYVKNIGVEGGES
jgi:hypothetical protein